MNPMIIPAAIGAVSSFFGGERANAANRKEARKNREFQERMSSTSWQRGIADMRAAGINPAVAYSKGGASSPGGSMATQSDTVTPAVNSAMAARRLQSELQAIENSARASYYAGEKSSAEAQYQHRLNQILGTSRNPGPLWDLHIAQAGTAREVWRGKVLDNALLKNLADVAKTPAGKSLAYIRYLLQSIKGK